MATRLELQSKLEELLGNKHVYYQPPSNIKMEYPCVKYSKNDIDSKYANNSAYLLLRRYDITVIDRRPDNAVIDKILALPYASYERHYISDNLHHDTITIYF